MVLQEIQEATLVVTGGQNMLRNIHEGKKLVLADIRRLLVVDGSESKA